MASLIKCKACGNMIAKDAAVCPQCGKKNKKRGCGCGVVLVALLVILAIGFIAQKGKEAGKQAADIKQQVQQKQADEEKAKLAAMTPEQRKEYQKEKQAQMMATQFADKFERSFDGSIKPVVEYVKQRMKNPDSFTHVKTNWFINTDAERQYVVRMQYRGTNSFGAVVTETVEFIVGQDGQIIKHPALNQN